MSNTVVTTQSVKPDHENIKSMSITNWSSSADINVSTGSVDPNLNGAGDDLGFYVGVHPDGVAGTLRVVFMNDVETTVLLGTIGYNPVYVKSIVPGHIDNTALKVWGGR